MDGWIGVVHAPSCSRETMTIAADQHQQRVVGNRCMILVASLINPLLWLVVDCQFVRLLCTGIDIIRIYLCCIPSNH